MVLSGIVSGGVGSLAFKGAGMLGMGPRAAEVMVRGSHAWLIRERERPSELFRGEHLLSGH